MDEQNTVAVEQALGLAGPSRPRRRNALGDSFLVRAMIRTAAAADVFLGAALLFILEPLFVKMALPLFGGSPAVWNTAFVFFTAVLVLGYLYAHALARLDMRRQVVVHTLLLLAVFLVLPVGVTSQSSSLTGSPSLWLFALLVQHIGLPFFALSATSPLLQSWVARAGDRNPYRLYAASNLGSVVALLAYPFLIEPFFGLTLQTRVWTLVYAVFVGLTVINGLRAIRGSRLTLPGATVDLAGSLLSREVTGRQRVLWVALAAVPVFLMMGLTAHLSTEIAPIPFVWTLPPALYLISFVVVFSELRWLSPQVFVRLVPYAVLPIVVLLALHEKLTLGAYVTLHLLMFFLIALALNSRLAASRPAPEHLTEFYLWVSVGGGIGGALAVLVAPRIFSNIGEYPLGIVLACVLLPATIAQRADLRTRFADLALPLGLVAAIGLLTHAAPLETSGSMGTTRFWLALGAGICLLFFARPVRFAVALAVLLLFGALVPDPNGHVIARERNFFGPKRIFVDPSGRYHFLLSGGTVHGVQALELARATEPLGYYSKSGPLGDIFSAGARRLAGRAIGAVGLGVGSAACYATGTQSWTFYEIDPAVLEMAREPRYFSLLSSCAPGARIVLGDARLSLDTETPQPYALIIVDAYNSDQVPLHLVTREALAIYLRRLTDDGILGFHISNRHFNLAPVLAALADDAGLVVLERDDTALSASDLRAGRMSSSWIVMTRRGRMPPALVTDTRWRSPARDDGLPLWTDDYSSLVRVLRR